MPSGAIQGSHAPLPAMDRAESAAPAVSAGEIARLRADARFPDVALGVASAITECYRGSRILNRLLNDRGRFTLALLILNMHLEPPGEDSRSGLTATRLKAQAVELGICSAGRAGAVLAAFRLLGLVTSVPDRDRRLNRLVATDQLIELHRDRWRRILKPMALMMPEGATGLAKLDDPAFFAPFVAALLEPFMRGWRLLHDVPELAMFADRDAGVVIALSLLETGRGHPPRPIAHLAKHFGVSRSHILAMFQDAEQAGLVRRPQPRGGAVAEPPMVDALERTAAVIMLMQAQAVRDACAVLDQNVVGVPFPSTTTVASSSTSATK